MMMRPREELATLQRQVESIGRSLQPATPSLSTYQAPPTSTPTANRTVPYPTPDSGPNHTRVDPTGVPKDRDTVPNVRPDRGDGDDHQTPRPRRQDSKSSLLSHSNIDDTAKVEDADADANYEQKDDKTMDIEQPQQQEYEPEVYNEGNFNYEQNYQQNPEPTYEQSAEQNYEQTPEQVYEQNPADYQNGAYEQNYQQQPYTTEQYGNYEQYPDQQYADPNAQYDGQYENYANDGNYEQNYNNTQFNQEYPSNNETIDKQNVQYNQDAANSEKQDEDKTNNAPKEQLSS